MSRIIILSHQDFPLVVSPCLSLRCTPLVRPTLEIHVSWLHLFFHVFLWLCALAFIWTPRFICENRHVSWVHYTLRESSNSIDCCAPLRNQCSQLSLCAHQPKFLLDQCAPCLMLFLVLIVATLCGSVVGVVQPLWRAHAIKGIWFHFLGVLPNLPNATQVFVIHHKGRRMCVPLGFNIKIMP
jgi:hypothetical protein